MCFGPLQQLEFSLQVGRAHLLEILFHALHAFFNLPQIADHKVEFDVLNVAQGVNGSDVRNRIVFKGAHHVNDRVHLAQMAEVGRLLQCLLPDGTEINVVNRRVRKLFWIVLRREPVETVVGNFCNSDVCVAWVRGCR